MANKKISELDELTSTNPADVLPIVSGSATKKITVANLLGGLPGYSEGVMADRPISAASGTFFLATDINQLFLYSAVLGWTER